AGRATLVVVDLAVGEAGVGIDSGVHVAHASTAALLADSGGGAAMGVPAAAVGDAAKFLDVDVDELAGVVGVDPADHPPGGAVHPAQAVQPEPAEHPMDRRGRHPQLEADASWSTLQHRSQSKDPG